jgi:hypothetical protein
MIEGQTTEEQMTEESTTDEWKIDVWTIDVWMTEDLMNAGYMIDAKEKEIIVVVEDVKCVLVFNKKSTIVNKQVYCIL